MKVSFSQKEYARLLELVYMGLYVAGAHSEEGSTPERYNEVTQTVLALSESFGCAHLVDATEDGTLVPSSQLEEGHALKVLDQFVDDSFWEELANRLASRDLLQELGVSILPVPLDEAQEARLEELEQLYWDELQNHGLARLFLLKGGQG